MFINQLYNVHANFEQTKEIISNDIFLFPSPSRSLSFDLIKVEQIKKPLPVDKS